MSVDREPENHEPAERRFRVGRRVVVGAAVWSVPVISVAAAAPALAGSGTNTVTVTNPASGTFAADQVSTTQPLAATLTDANNQPISGAAVSYSVASTSGASTAWISFNPVTATTDANGLASTLLTYGTPKPATGSTFTVTATYMGTTATWTLTYTALPSLMTVRLGDGTAALSSAATAAFLDEFAIDGTTKINTVAVPTTTMGNNRRLTNSGTATSEGALVLSQDRRLLTFGGYDAATGTASIANTTSAANNRIVARIGKAGSSSLDTTTALTDHPTANNIRGAVSNNTDVWVAGAESGVRHTTDGTVGTSDPTETANASVRSVVVAGGQLYLSTGSSPAGIYAVGSGLPTTATTVTTTIIAAAASPYGFVFLDRATTVDGVDTLYIADDTASTGGIRKFYLSGTTWTAAGVFTGAGPVRGLAGAVNANGYAALVASTTATSGNTLISVVDTSAYNATFPANATMATIGTAATNTVFRGVAFSPDVA